MAQIHPIPAITYDFPPDADMLPVIAPPYDVLDEKGKAELLSRNDCNIVAVDLPHLPAKTVGPDATYATAGELYRQWLADGTLVRRAKPALFAYRQSYTHAHKTFKRCGLFTNLTIQPFGPAADGKGGIHPHEQTFSGPKEDRLKLMRATKAQLSPIFGLHSDPTGILHALLNTVIARGPATLYGTTATDRVLHEIWAIEEGKEIQSFQQALAKADIFIADGHHRYNTALNYKGELVTGSGGTPLPPNHPANYCLFVLVAMQDPGMIVLPTHRVLGGMTGFSLEALVNASKGKLKIAPFLGKDLHALEAALPKAGPHAMGLYNPAFPDAPLSIMTTDADPLKATHGKMSPPWRQLDVAILQHVLVEQILEPTFCKAPASKDGKVLWKFPHKLEEVPAICAKDHYQLGVIVQPTPLDSVRLVSEAGDLMPQKSTFFYPKLATGLIINPLE
jgi:uncharacterized protein (DUF1015 family)